MNNILIGRLYVPSHNHANASEINMICFQFWYFENHHLERDETW